MKMKIDIGQLENGFEFPPVTFTLDAALTSAYLNAVTDTTDIYEKNNCIPPMAVAALAMAEMGKQIELPSGSIHVSQEFEFLKTATPGDELTSYATVKRNLARGKLHMLTIGINVLNQERETVVSGDTGFILPRL